MELITRFLNPGDADEVHALYHEIASNAGSFVRAPEEVTREYIDKLLRDVSADGLGIGAVDRAAGNGKLVGFIVARKPGPKVFDHVLSDLTIGVAPAHQRRGVGRRLFLDFIEHIQLSRQDIIRVELLVRESAQQLIAFYESIGFRSEGVFEKRIRNENGSFESDIPMGWLKVID